MTRCEVTVTRRARLYKLYNMSNCNWLPSLPCAGKVSGRLLCSPWAMAARRASGQAGPWDPLGGVLEPRQPAGRPSDADVQRVWCTLSGSKCSPSAKSLPRMVRSEARSLVKEAERQDAFGRSLAAKRGSLRRGAQVVAAVGESHMQAPKLAVRRTATTLLASKPNPTANEEET